MHYLFSILLLGLVCSQSALAKNNVFTIDLTKNFRDTSLNLLQDSDMTDPTGGGVDVIIPSLPGMEFVVGFGGSPSTTSKYRKSCQIRGILQKAGRLVMRLDADVDYDSGDTCELRIRYAGGQHARVSLYKTGT